MSGTAEAVTPHLAATVAVGPTDGRTTVQLPTSDQDALHAALAVLHQASVPVLRVSRVRPSLEDIFVSLLKGD